MWMLSFDMTDYQSSVTVRKYTEGQEALALQSAIAPGMCAAGAGAAGADP